MTGDRTPETVTEIDITGSNCPWCVQETLERLRAEPGVITAQATIAGPCIRIVHDGRSDEGLLAVVRRLLHAVDTSLVEATMIEVDAQVADLHCTHHRP